MIEMKSSATVLNGTPADVYNRLSNPGDLDAVLRNVLEKARVEGKDVLALEKHLESITFTENSISIASGPVGTLTFSLGNCTPNSNVQYIGSPLTIILDFNLEPEGLDKCILSINVQVDMPSMLRPMVQTPLRKGLDSLIDLFGRIPSWKLTYEGGSE